jgi:hypothetical protein
VCWARATRSRGSCCDSVTIVPVRRIVTRSQQHLVRIGPASHATA